LKALRMDQMALIGRLSANSRRGCNIRYLLEVHRDQRLPRCVRSPVHLLIAATRPCMSLARGCGAPCTSGMRASLRVSPCGGGVAARALDARRGVRHVCRAAQSGDDFGAQLARMAKKIQGSLPIIGLVSRLTSPEGGFDDDLSYTEFARLQYDRAPEGFNMACYELEKRYGKNAGRRNTLFCLWLARHQAPWVPARDLLASARRAGVTGDLEVEVDRVMAAAQEARKKKRLADARAAVGLEAQLGVAVDCLCRCCLLLDDGAPVPEGDVGDVAKLVRSVFPEATDAQIDAAVQGRAARAKPAKV